MKHIKLYERFNELDPYYEEDWDDNNLDNKLVKILEIGITNSKYYDIMLCKAIATKENLNTLTFRYINEYDKSLSVPIGGNCIHWGVDYIIVDNVNNIGQYVNEMIRKIRNRSGRWCFVFDKDTPNDIILKYARLLYPHEKVDIVKQD